jgi:DNA-binding transcriptional LysR family regulator
MEMHQVRYFVALCENLNFTRAAENCGVSQPSLTKAIQRLEEELGGPRRSITPRRRSGCRPAAFTRWKAARCAWVSCAPSDRDD